MATTLPYTFVDGAGHTASGAQVTANDQALATAIDALIPAGTVNLTARSTAAPGYLLCDGAAVSRTTYAGLFSAIGTVYGAGDGSTTFNLPDLQGRVPVGKGTHASVDVLGENEGAALANRTPKHYHSYTASMYTSPGLGAVAGTATGGGVFTNNTNDSTGPQNTVAYLVLNYQIKT